jgi:hypothetical protein
LFDERFDFALTRIYASTENRQSFIAEARCTEVRHSARLQLLCFCWVLAGTFLEARTGERALF